MKGMGHPLLSDIAKKSPRVTSIAVPLHFENPTLIYSEQRQLQAQRTVKRQWRTQRAQEVRAFKTLCRTAFGCAAAAQPALTRCAAGLQTTFLHDRPVCPTPHYGKRGRSGPVARARPARLPYYRGLGVAPHRPSGMRRPTAMNIHQNQSLCVECRIHCTKSPHLQHDLSAKASSCVTQRNAGTDRRTTESFPGIAASPEDFHPTRLLARRQRPPAAPGRHRQLP